MVSFTPGVTALVTREEYVSAVGQVRAAADAYYGAGTSPLSDAEYDSLLRGVARAEADHPDWMVADTPVGAVGGGVSGGAAHHAEPLLSLDNVFSTAELAEWNAALLRRVGRNVTEYVVEPKMDGLALAAMYIGGTLVRLALRGDGLSGDDVTYAAANVVGLPAELSRPVSLEVRGEVMLTADQFDAANEARIENGDKPFANARNGAAGALRGAGSRSYRIPLTFFGYGIAAGSSAPVVRHSEAMALLDDLGVNTVQASIGGKVYTDFADAAARVAELETDRAKLGFVIDGAVVKANVLADQVAAGTSSRAPHWAIAYKYPPDTALSTLLEVIWQIGRTGVITPRARIRPTSLMGTTIEYATLHNPGDVARKGFMLGDTVTVVRAGEVIPRLEAPLPSRRTGQEQPITPPEVCPRCGSDIDRSQERWRCTRGRKCGLVESVRYAAARDAWDIEGIGEKIVAGLVEQELVTSVADLFTVSRDELLTLDRMGDLTVDKILAEVDNARTSPLARTITALGIRGTGRTMSRRLAQHFHTMDALQRATVAELSQVDGIGEEKAPLIVAELAELVDVIAQLAAAGVAMGDEPTAVRVDTLPLDGKTVVVSGAMTGTLARLSRNEVNELIERAGGKASSSVSKKTSFLVTLETGTSKATKASALGVPVLTPEEFAQMLPSDML